MSDKTPDILIAALRRYQHNDCSGFVTGFDYDETVMIVKSLKTQRDELLAALKDCNKIMRGRKVINSVAALNLLDEHSLLIAKCEAQS